MNRTDGRVLGSELDNRLYYGRECDDLPDDQRRFVGTRCVAPGCNAHCLIGRPDGHYVSLKRGQELAIKMGWSKIRHRVWVCPEHNLQIKEDHDEAY